MICHHAAVTYSHVGGWYYLDGPDPGLGTKLSFATFETLNQAYFMGFLFLIAGYFVPRAFDTKGWTRFLRDRFVRLGILAAFFMLVIHPVTVYWLLRNFDDSAIPPLSAAYPRFLESGKVLSASGPMWFALALLIFCFAYAVARSIGPAGSSGWYVARPSVPQHKQVIGLIALMGTCSFLVRIVEPIGASILNMQLCYFSQYILLFVVGILAFRADWLRQIPRAFGIFWMKIALFAGIPGWLLLLATSGALRGDTRSLLGGLHWQSALFSFWEAFFCLGMCVGLIVLFRDNFNTQNPFAKWMSQNSFATYLFHTPLLVAVTLALKPLAVPVVVKFAMASLLAVPITFGISGLLRSKVPGLRRLL